MGITYQSVGYQALREKFNVDSEREAAFVIALAGNPNTGKSTIFNTLTGLNQHTGNWPGKTVLQAQGSFSYRQKQYLLVDLPGTYSLFANSVEEEVARDFICFGRPDVTVVVADSTCLERNLNLVLQVMEMTSRVVVCVNLLDEARRKGIRIDLSKLADELGVPVIGTSARFGQGLEELKQTLERIVENKLCCRPKVPIYDSDIEAKIREITRLLPAELKKEINPRWIALRLLEGDTSVLENFKNSENKETALYLEGEES